MAFGPGPEAAETFSTALLLDPSARCVALVAPSEIPALRAQWPESPNTALWIVAVEPEAVASTACDLLTLLPQGPVAVLLAALPSPHGATRQSRRQAAETVRRLGSCRSDVQVHLHSEDWPRRPPRVR